jgi:RecB family exonuclease
MVELMTPDEFKSLVETISNVVDMRAKTTELLLKAEIHASEERIQAELFASEQRTKDELRAEILAARAEAKVDHLHVRGKIDKIEKSNDKRLTALEEKTGSPNPEKH